MDIGKKIVELRENKGWSQYRLFKEAKIGQSTLSQIESGVKKSPNTATLQKIANALGVSMAEFDDNGPAFSRVVKIIDSHPNKEAAEHFKSLPPEEQKKLFDKYDALTNQELIDKIKKLSPEHRKAVGLIIEAFSATNRS